MNQPFAGDERSQLESWLDFQRTCLVRKCAGLDFEALTQRALPPSALSLLGLLRHMALVELFWFDLHFSGHEPDARYLDPNDDAVFDLDGVELDEVYDYFVWACERSRALSANHDLTEPMVKAFPGEDIDLRWIHFHMIEEYARHCGHADLLRETLDNSTGY